MTLSRTQFLTFLGVGLVIAMPAAAVPYTVRDLGQPVGAEAYHTVYGAGLNDSGQVVGYLNHPRDPGTPDYQGFVTGPGGTGFTNVGTLGGNWSRPEDINRAGQIVGSAGASDGSSHAFFAGPGAGALIDLGTLGGASSAATAINASGQVVGTARNTAGHERAFITDPGGYNLRDLGTQPGFHSTAYGINDRGQVVGEREDPTLPHTPENWYRQAFVTGADGSSPREIDVEGFDQDHIWSGKPVINNRGDTAGSFGVWTGESRPFFAAAGADGIERYTDALRRFPPPGPGWVVRTRVLAMGADGQIGGQYTYGSEGGAFISSPGGVGLMDMNSLEFTNPDDKPYGFSDVTAINSAGQILANGLDQRMYLLTPVPEPATLALLLGGLGWLEATRRRRATAGAGRT